MGMLSGQTGGLASILLNAAMTSQAAQQATGLSGLGGLLGDSGAGLGVRSGATRESVMGRAPQGWGAVGLRSALGLGANVGRLGLGLAGALGMSPIGAVPGLQRSLAGILGTVYGSAPDLSWADLTDLDIQGYRDLFGSYYADDARAARDLAKAMRSGFPSELGPPEYGGWGVGNPSGFAGPHGPGGAETGTDTGTTGGEGRDVGGGQTGEAGHGGPGGATMARGGVVRAVRPLKLQIAEAGEPEVAIIIPERMFGKGIQGKERSITQGLKRVLARLED